MILLALEFDSTLGDEVDLLLPTAESKEELDEEDEEVEEEIEEELDEEGEGNWREEERGESGAETSESEAVVVSPRHSRARNVTDVRRLIFLKLRPAYSHPTICRPHLLNSWARLFKTRLTLIHDS